MGSCEPDLRHCIESGPKDSSLSPPRVSVVIPAYNAAGTIRAACLSVLQQTVRDLQLIVVDNGSTDDTVQQVTALRDARMGLVHQTVRGPSAARNAGVRCARADLIAFLDADDVWERDKLERQLASMGPEVQVSYTDCYLSVEGRRLRPTFHDVSAPPSDGADMLLGLLRRHNFIPLSTACVRRAAFAEAGGFSERLMVAEDWDLWLRLAAGGARFSRLAQPLAEYTLRQGTLSDDMIMVYRSELEVLGGILPALPRRAHRAAQRRARQDSLYLLLASRSEKQPFSDRFRRLIRVIQLRGTPRIVVLQLVFVVAPRWFMRAYRQRSRHRERMAWVKSLEQDLLRLEE